MAVFDRETGEWTVWKEPYVQMINYADDEPIGISNSTANV